MSVSTLAALNTANYLERNGREMIINEIVNPELRKLQLAICNNHRAIYNKVQL